MSLLLDVLIFAVSWTHVLLAPYTKVEESFNLHAIHDLLFYGGHPDALQKFDHKVFPGPVPRSFVGSIIIAWLSNYIARLANHFSLINSKFDLQIVVRLTLASINAQAFCLLRRAVARRFGRLTSLFFTLITISQFHVPFWMGRTIPNMLALPFVNIALSLLLGRGSGAGRASITRASWAVALLTFAAVAIRAEIAGLLGLFAIQLLLDGTLSITRLVKVGLSSGLVSIALTVSIDSYFWGHWPLWPSFRASISTFMKARAPNGVSPFWTYFSTSLPRLLMVTNIFTVYGFYHNPRIRSLVRPAIGFVFLMSFLGHKEWRFIVYVVPMLNIAAAQGAQVMIRQRKGRTLGLLAFLIVVGSLVLNTATTIIATRASIANYPGGHALALFNKRYGESPNVHVHIGNLAAQSGASLFLHTHSPPYRPHLGIVPPSISAAHPWIYNKTEENLTSADIAYDSSFTHAIAEDTDSGHCTLSRLLTGSVDGR
ncbi:GPI mannosyltransferase [Russula aff. rugulosa BPL654]|nr:GPI mannosyltransferase [Russula aff. rugulosa BPL654]